MLNSFLYIYFIDLVITGIHEAQFYLWIKGKGILKIESKMLPVYFSKMIRLYTPIFFSFICRWQNKGLIWTSRLISILSCQYENQKYDTAAGRAKWAIELAWCDVGRVRWFPNPGALGTKSSRKCPTVPKGACSGQLNAIRTAEGDLTSLCLAVRMTPSYFFF